MSTSGAKLFQDRYITFMNHDGGEDEIISSPVFETSGKIPVFLFARNDLPGTRTGITQHLQVFASEVKVPRFDRLSRTEQEITHDRNAIGEAILAVLKTSENVEEGLHNIKIWYRKLSIESPDMLVVTGMDRKGEPRLGIMEYDPMERKTWREHIVCSGYVLRTDHFGIHPCVPRKEKNSPGFQRLEVAKQLVEKSEYVVDIMDLLKYHDGSDHGPSSICRHFPDTGTASCGNPDNAYRTNLSVITEYIFASSEFIVHYAPGNPCRNEFLTSKFRY